MIQILWRSSAFSCCVLGKVIALQDYLVSCSRQDVLNTNITYKMISIPKHWYAGQFVYSHYVIDTNDNFRFLGIGEKFPPVLLQIEVSFLNKYTRISSKSSRLVICS